jgi:DNA-binding Xre family transcriptional regulator
MKRAGAKHIGSKFDDFLREVGDYEAVKGIAVKRVLAWQLAAAMKEQGVAKIEMARRMGTSRSQIDRLLDPDNDNVTLSTLKAAASALGHGLKPLELA